MALWIESHVELKDHPKLLLLKRALSITTAEAVGHLHLLWWWCAEHAIDGDISKFKDAVIADAAGYPGDEHAFLCALIDCEFVDPSPNRIHEWHEYFGKLLAKRAQNAAHQAQHRSRKTHVSLTDTDTTLTETLPSELRTPTVPPLDRNRYRKTKDTPCKSPKGDGDKPAAAARKALSEKVGGLFDRFYGAFPRKVNPAVAARSFGKVFAGLDDAEVDALAVRIGVGLKAYKAYVAGKDIEYVQHPGSWLNARAWESEYGATTPKAFDAFEEARMMPQCRTPRELTAPSIPADLAALDAENADALWEAARMMS